MAITYEQVMNILSHDPWTGEQIETQPDFSVLKALTVGDYKKWLRKMIREHGRRYQIGTVHHHPVDMFVLNTTGLDFTLGATGEIEITANNQTYELMSDAMSLAYYIYDDNGNLVTTAGKALDLALDLDDTLLVDPSSFLC
jgi:hypothetical protein